MNLDELAIKYNTDKSSLLHDYANIYERYLCEHKTDYADILEIGVLNGSSLKMWADYFVYANIWGLDINPDCAKFADQRTKILIGNQNDEAFIRESIINKGMRFNMIIDDGGHKSSDQIGSFNLLFDSLNGGGYYIIEDVCCSYWDWFNGEGITAVEYFKGLIDHVNFFGYMVGNTFDRRREYLLANKPDLSKFEKTIKGIYFYNSTIIVEKV